LALGIFLKRAGFGDFTIFDREGGVGGTWRINTYPGLACDVKSHLYSYSFDLNADWSRLWSGQVEILAYFERCAQRYGLEPHLALNTEVTSAQWNADSRTWLLTTTTRSTPSISWCRRSGSSPNRHCRRCSRRSRSRAR
jgi:cyclohexanone monooxygenase